jgi:hypothetical protein
MVLSFLPHESGHRRVATKQKISRGPLIFSYLIQNWQLVSERLAARLKFTRIPTIRYFPQQAGSDNSLEYELPADNLLGIRKAIRAHKLWGRYWLTSESVCPDSNGRIRVQWGQIFDIQKGTGVEGEEPIRSGIYALIRDGQKQLSRSNVVWLPDGIHNNALYNPDKFIELLIGCIDDAEKSALEQDPELENRLPWKALHVSSE